METFERHVRVSGETTTLVINGVVKLTNVRDIFLSNGVLIAIDDISEMHAWNLSEVKQFHTFRQET